MDVGVGRKTLIKVFHQGGQGVRYIHYRGWIQRDLKPTHTLATRRDPLHMGIGGPLDGGCEVNPVGQYELVVQNLMSSAAGSHTRPDRLLQNHYSTTPPKSRKVVQLSFRARTGTDTQTNLSTTGGNGIKESTVAEQGVVCMGYSKDKLTSLMDSEETQIVLLLWEKASECMECEQMRYYRPFYHWTLIESDSDKLRIFVLNSPWSVEVSRYSACQKDAIELMIQILQLSKLSQDFCDHGIRVRAIQTLTVTGLINNVLYLHCVMNPGCRTHIALDEGMLLAPTQRGIDQAAVF
ncbi:hypothetical protein AYO21_10189 [Fonsecaea monophora]|uniref:Uncharacterized protein n=1 Tax=Fonsecaea monophora TaxID=254056 RepID=A0A177EXG6_9EURO|nr:hypothetical protein AYO21_10189 [Fonsecaea monophora]OAG35649.1 hypothetical protein AYO21_10189 [Fonsecaea monophora]